MAADIGTVADTLLACVCDALEDAGRPACTCTTTVGTPLVSAFCECHAGDGSGELYVSFSTMYPVDPETLTRSEPVYPCRRPTMAAEFSVLLTRCFPTIDEKGELPSAERQADAADLLHADAQDIWTALTCCAPELGRMRVSQVFVADPEGGISSIQFVVVVEVKVKKSPSIEAGDVPPAESN